VASSVLETSAMATARGYLNATVVLLTCLTTLLVSACYDGYYLHLCYQKIVIQ
jgi:hypothetical protein